MAKPKTRAQELLSGSVFRIQVPNLVTALPVGMASVYYLIQTTPQLPEQAIRPILTAVAAAVVLTTPVMQLIYGRLIGILSKLASGKLPPTVENLQAAVRQTHRFADRLVVLIGFVWVATTMAGVAWLPFSDLGVTWPLALRMLGRTLLLLPTGLVNTYLITAFAARGVVRRLQECGLSVEQLVAAIPTRRGLRWRVVAFMLVLTGTPAVLSVDLVSALSERAMTEMSLLSPQLQQAATMALSHARTTVLVLGGFILVLGLAGSVLWGASIGKPLRSLAAQAERIASGDLSASPVAVAEDEMWAVSSAISSLHADLARLLSDMQRAGFSVSTAAEQMLSHAESSRSGAASQALSAHQTSSATEEMARVAEQIAEKAGAVAETAAQTLAAARSGQDSSRVFNDAINSLARDNLAVADAVVRLKKGMNQIGRIVEFINGIADKSDLLALNAELEGTKAGELGRGFSLVAGEMRRLAENIMKSTREISGLIEEVRDATQAAVSATETGIHATETGARVAETLAQSLQKIVELAQTTAESATTINFATQQQRSSSAQLAETMQSILEVTQTTEAATRNVSASSTDLAQLARQLKGAVQRFKIQA